jgi:EAL domain-containing protein (putative c-di-GMP-specific phosphodiesterase class I)
MLLNAGCRIMQRFLFSHPLPAVQLAGLLKRGRVQSRDGAAG